jgi:hypothetical protein
VFGRPLITVEWYPSTAAAIEGLTKNAFAGVDYSLLNVAAATAGLLLTNVWPFLGAVMTHGLPRILNLASVALIAALFLMTSNGARRLYVIGYPLAALLFAYILWRSALIAVATGTVSWRGTSYPLAAMRRNRI